MKRAASLVLAIIVMLSFCLTVFAAGSSFSDVPANASYAQAVDWCQENNILNGVGGNRFDPNGTLTRAMLATALYRAAGEPAVSDVPAFTDTQPDTWYSSAVTWANGRGLVQGYGNDLFGTYDPVSVEQLEVILGRYTGNNTKWTGDPAKAHAAIRAQIAVALYDALAKEDDEPTNTDSKVLVAYFSATRNTENVAKYIADKLGADIFELVPEKTYTSADLNYSNSTSRVCQEYDDPALQDVKLLATTPDNWADYDVVFIGYPIWWHAAAWPVNHFVTDNDFSGKTVIPFCTSVSSGLEDSDVKLQEMAKDGDWLEGRRFPSGASQTTVEQWVDTLVWSDNAPS